MSRKRLAYDCEDCGTPTVRRRERHQPLLCVECSILRVARANREMALGAGEAYAVWKESAGPRGRPRKKRQE